MNGEVNSILGKLTSQDIGHNMRFVNFYLFNLKILLYFCTGDHTKVLIGQLIIFNQILGELREDIREQVCE